MKLQFPPLLNDSSSTDYGPSAQGREFYCFVPHANLHSERERERESNKLFLPLSPLMSSPTPHLIDQDSVDKAFLYCQ